MTAFQINRRWSRLPTITVEIDAALDSKSHGIRLGEAVRVGFGTGADLTDADLTGAVLRGAVLTDADLRGAVLTDADLRGADLRGAVLRGAVLTDADFTGAVLRGAVLTGAVLRGAVLRGAVLTGAVLMDADLTDAVLTDADLTDAVLTPIEADFYHVLVGARAEAPGLLKAIREGRINGSTYTGECPCLVGTIANLRGVDVETLAKNSNRPIERFFLAINKGDTPATSQHAKLAEEWLLRFIGSDPAAASPETSP